MYTCTILTLGCLSTVTDVSLASGILRGTTDDLRRAVYRGEIGSITCMNK